MKPSTVGHALQVVARVVQFVAVIAAMVLAIVGMREVQWFQEISCVEDQNGYQSCGPDGSQVSYQDNGTALLPACIVALISLLGIAIASCVRPQDSASHSYWPVDLLLSFVWIICCAISTGDRSNSATSFDFAILVDLSWGTWALFFANLLVDVARRRSRSGGERSRPAQVEEGLTLSPQMESDPPTTSKA